MKRGDSDALYAFLDSTGGMDTFTAKVLATTTFICQTTASVSRPVRDFLNYYRIAAVHDRDRLARRVRELIGPRWRRKASMTEAIIAVISLDYTHLFGAKTGVGLENSMSEAMRCINVHRSLDADNAVAADALALYGRIRHLSIVTNPSRHTTRTLTDGHAQRPAEPTVRVGNYTSPINLAIAEFVIQTCPDTVLNRGRDINLDMAVAAYFNNGGDFTFTHPDGDSYPTPEVALVDAVRRELGTNPVELIVPAAGDLADAAGTDAMWLTSPDMVGVRGVHLGDITDDALLTESGVHYLLHRVRAWTSNPR